MRLILTTTAKADLRAIHAYIKKDNPKAATAFTKDLTKKLFSLAASGVTGAPRDWVSTGLRVFPYRDRCFYLRIVDDRMYVVRVLHDRQDIAAQDFPAKIWPKNYLYQCECVLVHQVHDCKSESDKALSSIRSACAFQVEFLDDIIMYSRVT